MKKEPFSTGKLLRLLAVLHASALFQERLVLLVEDSRWQQWSAGVCPHPPTASDGCHRLHKHWRWKMIQDSWRINAAARFWSRSSLRCGGLLREAGLKCFCDVIVSARSTTPVGRNYRPAGLAAAADSRWALNRVGSLMSDGGKWFPLALYDSNALEQTTMIRNDT